MSIALGEDTAGYGFECWIATLWVLTAKRNHLAATTSHRCSILEVKVVKGWSNHLSYELEPMIDWGKAKESEGGAAGEWESCVGRASGEVRGKGT